MFQKTFKKKTLIIEQKKKPALIVKPTKKIVLIQITKNLFIKKNKIIIILM